MKRIIRFVVLCAGLAGAFAAFSSGSALADECDSSEQQKGGAGSFRKVERGGETIYEFTGVIRVCGKVPKPNVVVILLEKTVEYEWERLKQDFSPRIGDALRKAPF